MSTASMMIHGTRLHRAARRAEISQQRASAEAWRRYAEAQANARADKHRGQMAAADQREAELFRALRELSGKCNARGRRILYAFHAGGL